jgi:hypothetical protein
MAYLHHFHAMLYDQFGDSMYFVLGFIVMLSVVAQWRLYERAGQPGVAAVVPFWNFVVFLRIVGRPASHMWLFLIPIYGQFYMIPKVWIELCQSFGKRTMLDYVLVIIFNGIYIFNLGMSYDTRYMGPVYGKHIPTDHGAKHRPSLA